MNPKYRKSAPPGDFIGYSTFLFLSFKRLFGINLYFCIILWLYVFVSIAAPGKAANCRILRLRGAYLPILYLRDS